jgi:hypothetical protein
MRHFSRILFLLGVTLSCVALSHAQTATVKDNLQPGSPADHGPIQHWQQFSTTLSASPDATPVADKEYTLDDPTYKWSCSDQTVQLTSYTGQTVGLQNSSGTELPQGAHSVNVNCTITYAEHLTSDSSKTGSVPAGSGSITVKFFSTKPVSVKSLESDPIRGSNVSETYNEEGYPSRKEYRQYAQYSFAVLDNQPTAHYYFNGDVHEIFGPTITANSLYQNAIQNQGAPGPEATKPNTGGVFTDGNGWTTGDFKYPNKWPQALVDATTAAGRDDFWYSFTQKWEYVEYPIGSSVAQRTPLQNSSFTISFHRGYVERH